MAPKRDQRRDQAYEIYKQYGGKIANRQIAEILEVPEKTIGSWKSKAKDDWEAKLAAETNGVLQSQERSTPIEKGGTSPPGKRKRKAAEKEQGDAAKQTKRHKGGQPGNDNAAGHGAPEGNENAVKHGFYRSLLPTRLQKIAEQMEGRNLLEMLREQITVLSSIIYDSLQQLYVEDMDDHRNFVTKEQQFTSKEDDDEAESVVEIEREWHAAWDRQAKALQGYERQVGRFQSLVRTYMELSGEGDAFRLQIERMKKDIEVKELEIEKLKGGGGDSDKAKAWSDAVKRMEERRKKRDQQQGGDTP